VDVEKFDQSYKNLAKKWKVYQHVDTLSIDVIIHAVHSEFGKRRTINNKKSLIVFDNAPAGFIGEKFKGQLPSITDILITSKSSEWEIKVDLSTNGYQLTQEEGLGILKKWIPQEKYDDKEAHAIVNTFSNLPVVIAQAGNFIAKSRLITMANFLSEFAKNKKEILTQGKLKNPQDNGFIDLYTSVKMTMEEIAEMETRALELVRYCAHLPGKSIPVELLLKLFGSELLLLNRCLNTLGTLVIYSESTLTIHELFQEIILEESQPFAIEVLAQLAKASLNFEEFLSTNPNKALLIYQQALKSLKKIMKT
jgi:hypothetical protein